MTSEELMNLARQMIDPRNTQAPVLGAIRQFNQQTFGTPWYLNPDLPPEEKMMNMAMSFGPASIGKVKPAVEIIANPVMKKALEMSRKIGTERIPTIDETSDIIKMARGQLKLPKNVFNRMSPRELLDELTSLATKNQKYAYQELPQATKGVGGVVSKVLEPLAQEARKYKNAEEFYHLYLAPAMRGELKGVKSTWVKKKVAQINEDLFPEFKIGKVINEDYINNLRHKLHRLTYTAPGRKIESATATKIIKELENETGIKFKGNIEDFSTEIKSWVHEMKRISYEDTSLNFQKGIIDFYTQATKGVYGR